MHPVAEMFAAKGNLDAWNRNEVVSSICFQVMFLAAEFLALVSTFNICGSRRENIRANLES